MKVGVLALQGAFREHIDHVSKAGFTARPVRTVPELDECDSLIIPGGESTTIGKLMVTYGLLDVIKDRHSSGMPLFGTCAGAILLAQRITEGSQPLLGLMDIEVRRNAYGRQTSSFEADINIPVLGGEPLHGVFIRAPWIESVGQGVEVLAEYGGRIVAARQGNLVVTTFHPELTPDLRLHRYFAQSVAGAMPRSALA